MHLRNLYRIIICLEKILTTIKITCFLLFLFFFNSCFSPLFLCFPLLHCPYLYVTTRFSLVFGGDISLPIGVDTSKSSMYFLFVFLFFSSFSFSPLLLFLSTAALPVSVYRVSREEPPKLHECTHT
jgi:hypothetical protein